MAKLINGNGNPAVYAAEDADMLAGIMGNVTTITAVGNEFAATASGANLIEVADGVILTQEGRRIQLDAGITDAFTIPSGTAGTTNYYIIGYRLYESASGTQECETFVQLMASSTDTIPEETFRGGATEVFVSLYRVEQDGVNLGTITSLLPKVSGVSQINSDLSEKVTSMTGVSGYQTVDVLGYNPTTKKLGLKVNGADTVIPFSGGLYANPDITKRIKKLDTTAYTLSKDLIIYGSFYTSNINIGLQYSKDNGSTWLDLFQGENYGGSAYAGIVTVPPTLIPKRIRLKFNSSVGSSVALYEKLERPVLPDITQRVAKLSHTDVYTCNEDLVLYGTFFTININDGVTYSLDNGTTWIDLLQGANYGGTVISDYLNIPPVLIPKDTQIKITSNWNGAGTPYLYKPLS